MKDQLLKDSIELLKEVRSEIHSTVEDSVIEELDKIIQDLEDIQKERLDSFTTLEVLLLFGKALEYLPQIAGVIQHLITLINK